MKKADYKFHKDKNRQINSLSRQNVNLTDWYYNDNNPVYIPKRKKLKK